MKFIFLNILLLLFMAAFVTTAFGDPEYSSTSFIIKFTEEVEIEQGLTSKGFLSVGIEEIDELNDGFEVERMLVIDPYVASGSFYNLFVFYCAENEDIENVIDEYLECSDVEGVMMDQIASECTTPNDPLYYNQ